MLEKEAKKLKNKLIIKHLEIVTDSERNEIAKYCGGMAASAFFLLFV